ncbi:patatin-like phospholipase family protein [Vibrio viridaestus]|uniref:patatin-like phospholipase family protein n=1 Tax=Vibrio viridaestus TaxID=2487322 RepID=UPI001FB5E501|nr:DUF6363 domain-containing protein [Vibrio viridaestus]
MIINRGIVDNLAVTLNLNKLSKFVGGKNALVVQGGGQRGIFTAGVLDAFILSNIDPFDAFYGTSAGALNLCPFVCRQPLLGKAFISELTTDPRFFSLFRYIRHNEPLNVSWALDKICSYPYHLDIDLGKKVLGQRQCMAAVTRAGTLQDEYLPIFSKQWKEILRGSCAIPQLCGDSVAIGEQRYFDGGISASVPAQEAWRNGARLIVVIRTEVASELPVLASALPVNAIPVTTEDPGQWGQTIEKWFRDLNVFSRYKNDKADRKEQAKDLLNGGRWLFGTDYIYRIAYLLGTQFDSTLKDMLLRHYQSYAETMKFLAQPPDDCFIVEIAPAQPLRSNSLMTKKEVLLEDYQIGLDAGYHFVELLREVDRRTGQPFIYSKYGHQR